MVFESYSLVTDFKGVILRSGIDANEIYEMIEERYNFIHRPYEPTPKKSGVVSHFQGDARKVARSVVGKLGRQIKRG